MARYSIFFKIFEMSSCLIDHLKIKAITLVKNFVCTKFLRSSWFFSLLPFYFSPDLSISFHSSYKSELNSKYLPAQSQQKSTTKGVKYLQT